MKLGIYSLKKTLYQGEAQSVNCKTQTGEITILDDHEPLISVLKEGIIKIVDTTAEEHYIPVSSGFLEVRLNDCKLIVEENANNG